MGHEELRELIGKKRTLEILDLLASEAPLNYTEVEDRVQTSSDVVSDRLDLLVEYGLLERDEQSPKNVRYTITGDGEEFLERIDDIKSLLDS